MTNDEKRSDGPVTIADADEVLAIIHKISGPGRHVGMSDRKRAVYLVRQHASGLVSRIEGWPS